MNWVDRWDSHVSHCVFHATSPPLRCCSLRHAGQLRWTASTSTIASHVFTLGWERRHHYLTWKQHRIVWSSLPRLSNEASFCVLSICQGLGGPTVQPGGQGMLSSPEGEVVGGMRSQPLVCSLCTYIISQGWVIFLRVCVLCPSIIGKSRPTLVFRCRQLLTLECSVSWVCVRQEWSFFQWKWVWYDSKDSQIYVALSMKTWKVIWRVGKNKSKNKNHHSLETSPVGAVVSWILFYNFLIFTLKVP